MVPIDRLPRGISFTGAAPRTIGSVPAHRHVAAYVRRWCTIRRTRSSTSSSSDVSSAIRTRGNPHCGQVLIHFGRVMLHVSSGKLAYRSRRRPCSAAPAADHGACPPAARTPRQAAVHCGGRTAPERAGRPPPAACGPLPPPAPPGPAGRPAPPSTARGLAGAAATAAPTRRTTFPPDPPASAPPASGASATAGFSPTLYRSCPSP
jgi:hypothetical protein